MIAAPKTLRESFELCPYVSMIAPYWMSKDVDFLSRHVGEVCAVIENEFSPFDDKQLHHFLATLISGRVVLLMSTHSAVRDAAKRQITEAYDLALSRTQGHS